MGQTNAKKYEFLKVCALIYLITNGMLIDVFKTRFKFQVIDFKQHYDFIINVVDAVLQAKEENLVYFITNVQRCFGIPIYFTKKNKTAAYK